MRGIHSTVGGVGTRGGFTGWMAAGRHGEPHSTIGAVLGYRGSEGVNMYFFNIYYNLQLSALCLLTGSDSLTNTSETIRAGKAGKPSVTDWSVCTDSPITSLAGTEHDWSTASKRKVSLPNLMR